MNHRTEAVVAAALFVAMSLAAASTQRSERVFGDGEHYLRMSWQFADPLARVAAEAPFVYRLATPWLAARVDAWLAPIVPDRVARAVEDASGIEGVVPFYVVNVAAAALSLGLLLAFLRCFIADARLRLVLMALWMAAWHAPTRYVYFNPVNVEPLFLAMLLAGLLVIEKTRHAGAWTGALLIAPLVALAVLCRESGLLVWAAYAGGRRPGGPWRERHWQSWGALFLPLFAGLAALAFTREVAVATNAYGVLAVPWEMVRNKPPHSWLLACFFAFGPPALAVILAAAGPVRSFLAERPHLAVYLSLSGVIAFLGGTDTERILGWAMPVMLVLLGRAIESRQDVLRRAPALVGMLVVVQLASARLPWPVPVGVDDVRRTVDLDVSWPSLLALLDKFLVIDNYYANLWTYFGSRPVHAMILVFDLALVAGVIILLHRRGRRLQPAT